MVMRKKNKERAQRVANVLKLYKLDKLDESGPVREEDLTDLLTDIRHYCDKQKLAFHELDKMAYLHYCAENQRKESA